MHLDVVDDDNDDGDVKQFRIPAAYEEGKWLLPEPTSSQSSLDERHQSVEWSLLRWIDSISFATDTSTGSTCEHVSASGKTSMGAWPRFRCVLQLLLEPHKLEGRWRVCLCGEMRPVYIGRYTVYDSVGSCDDRKRERQAGL